MRNNVLHTTPSLIHLQFSGKTFTLLSDDGVTTRVVQHCFEKIDNDEIHTYKVGIWQGLPLVYAKYGARLRIERCLQLFTAIFVLCSVHCHHPVSNIYGGLLIWNCLGRSEIWVWWRNIPSCIGNRGNFQWCRVIWLYMTINHLTQMGLKTPSPLHLTTHSFCVFSRLRKLNFSNSFESSLVAFQATAIAKFWCFRSLSLITLCTNYYSRNQAWPWRIKKNFFNSF